MDNKSYKCILLEARLSIEKRLLKQEKRLEKRKQSSYFWQSTGNPKGRGRGRTHSGRMAFENGTDVIYKLIQECRDLIKVIDLELEAL